jgi:hypothetical protein
MCFDLPPITRVLLRGVSSSDDAAPGGGSDATIDALDLHAPGLVPWWRPETRNVTLHRILIHVIAETHRHAGQADIVRESIDGLAGLYDGNSNLPETDPTWWTAYRERVEQAALAHQGPTS